MSADFEICQWCDEPVSPAEQHPSYREPVHFACGMRMIVGSLAHVERRCSCFVPGATDTDPEHMSRRQGAEAALRAYRLRGSYGERLN
jgi:hypothetical protein